MTRTPNAILLSVVAVLAIGAGATALYLAQAPDPAPVPAAATSSPPTSKPAAKADPYKVYLKLAPAGAPNLSREDAQARAYLGCGQTWAPHTVDAALAEAYADLCKQHR